jgi:hypothetical protein
MNDDLESRLSDLEATAGVSEGDVSAWAEATVEQAVRDGRVEPAYSGTSEASGERVCLYSNGLNVTVPRSDVPAWVDLKELPVDV